MHAPLQLQYKQIPRRLCKVSLLGKRIKCAVVRIRLLTLKRIDSHQFKKKIKLNGKVGFVLNL